jgi:hypothetical protein
MVRFRSDWFRLRESLYEALVFFAHTYTLVFLSLLDRSFGSGGRLLDFSRLSGCDIHT